MTVNWQTDLDIKWPDNSEQNHFFSTASGINQNDRLTFGLIICSWVPFFVHAAHLERQWNTFFFSSHTLYLNYFRLSKQFQLIVASQKIIAKTLQMFNTSMLSIIEIYLLSLRSSFLILADWPSWHDTCQKRKISVKTSLVIKTTESPST